MEKGMNLIILALAFAVSIFAAAGHAEEYTCQGSVGAITVDNLRVPQEATCNLHGTYVEGTIKG